MWFLRYDTKCRDNKRKNIKFLCLKVHYQEIEDNPQNGRKYLQTIYLLRYSYLEYIKNIYKFSNNKKQITQVKNEQKTLP